MPVDKRTVRPRSSTRKRILLALALALPTHASAQPVGTLRDPQRSVFRAFPEATGYRTVIREIDDDARVRIERDLPFPVHFSELGPHGLYVALRERRPVGFLYVRSEESEWGFTEIVWLMSLDLRIVGFEFQRCRSRYAAVLRRSEFAKSLMGADLVDLDRIVGEDGELTSRSDAIPHGAEPLAAAVARSAMKALAVTHTVWLADVRKLQDLDMAMAVYPAGARFRRFGSDATEPPADRLLESIRGVEVRDGRGRVIGLVARTRGRCAGTSVELQWRLDPHGDVVDVDTVDPDAARAIREACRGFVDRDSERDSEIVAAIRRMAAELESASVSTPAKATR